MKKIEREVSFREKVYQELKVAIIRQTLTPGVLLNERRLAEELCVSRTPVREALQALEAEGWVSVLPRRGFYIKPVTAEDVGEIMEAWRCLEFFLLEKAELMMASDAQLELVAEAFRKHKNSRPMESIQNEYHCAHYGAEFHMLIAELSKNKVMFRWLQTLQDKIERIYVYVSTKDDLFEKTVREHEEIMNALRRRDRSGVLEAMKRHLEGSESRILKTLEQKK